jgi:glutaminase
MPDKTPAPLVSTGSLPSPEQVHAVLEEAHARFAAITEGSVSQVYPALARMDPALFGICVAGVGGSVFAVGDAEAAFSIMSVSKPFVFALLCEALGPAALRAKIGVNATGMAFDSAADIERSADGRRNPMGNAGAIATTSLAPGADKAAR